MAKRKAKREKPQHTKRTEKLFRDNVHGYIYVPKPIVEKIIDTEIFQRLKDVRQTGMQPLFPAVEHTRFIHSLGVYHLGTRAFQSLAKNARSFISKYNLDDQLILGSHEYKVLMGIEDGDYSAPSPLEEDKMPFEDAWWLKYEKLFGLACILHDCAHAPFSHDYEGYYKIPKIDTSDDHYAAYFEAIGLDPSDAPEKTSKLNMNLLMQFPSREFYDDFFGREPDEADDEELLGTLAKSKGRIGGKAAPHEKLSATCVGIHFRRACHEVLYKLANGEKNPLVVWDQASEKDPKKGESASASGYEDEADFRAKAGIQSALAEEDPDLEFIARAIIGMPYRHTTPELALETSLKNCFIELLNSTTFDVDGLDYIVRDAKNAGLASTEIDYDRLFRSLRVMRLRDVSGSACEGNVGGLWLQGAELKGVGANTRDSGSYFQVSGTFDILYQDTSVDSKDIIVGTPAELPSWVSLPLESSSWGLRGERGVAAKYKDKDGSIRLFTTNEGSACAKIAWSDAPEIEVDTKSPTWLDGSFKGSVKGWVVDQKATPAVKPGGIARRAKHIEYDFVYDHSCMSVLGQIMAARNYEYEWIFTHPKVLYSSFLEDYVPRLSSRFLCCKLHEDTSRFGEVPLSFASCELKEGTCRYNDTNDTDVFVPKIIGFDSFYATSRDAYFGISPLLDEGPGYDYTKLGHWFWRCSDSDMRALFKHVYLENHELSSKEGVDLSSGEIERYFSKYFNRNHQKPLWKSQGEFNAIFNPLLFAPDDLETLKDTFAKSSKLGSISYSILEGKLKDKFRKRYIENPVILNVSVKTKRLEPSQVYIYTSKFGVVPLDEMGIEGYGKSSKETFFYVYGDIAPNADIDAATLRELFKEVAEAINEADEKGSQGETEP